MTVIAFSSRHVTPEQLGQDGCPVVTWRFTHIVCPLVEMADKEGRSVHEKVSALLGLYNLSHGCFYGVTTDGGVEVTGNVRHTSGSKKAGTGCKGMFSMGFEQHGATWIWCGKHCTQLLFGDTDLSLVHNQLNTVSRFLRCANRMNKLKPHGVLVLKYGHGEEAEGLTEYHKNIAECMDELSIQAQNDQAEAFEKVCSYDVCSHD